MPPPFLKHEQGHIYNISSSNTDGLANWLTDRLTRLASSQLKISHKTIWLAGNTPLMIPHSILDGRKEETNQLVRPTSRLIEVPTPFKHQNQQNLMADQIEITRPETMTWASPVGPKWNTVQVGHPIKRRAYKPSHRGPLATKNDTIAIASIQNPHFLIHTFDLHNATLGSHPIS